METVKNLTKEEKMALVRSTFVLRRELNFCLLFYDFDTFWERYHDKLTYKFCSSWAEYRLSPEEYKETLLKLTKTKEIFRGTYCEDKMEFCKKNPYFISKIPKITKDYILCKEPHQITEDEFFQLSQYDIRLLVENNPETLCYIPEKRWDNELLSNILESMHINNTDYRMDYRCKIPEHLKKEAYWRTLCMVNGFYFSKLPEEYQYIIDESYLSMCLKFGKAYTSAYWLLESIDEKHKTHDICLEACLKHPMAIRNVPEQFLNDDFYVELMENGQFEFLDSIDLSTISQKNLITCLQSAKSLSFGSMKIPKKYWSMELVEALLPFSNTWNIIPAKYKTYDVCLKYVSKYGAGLKDIPGSMKDNTMCLAAMKSNAFAAKNYLPETMDEEFWNLVVEGQCFYHVKDLPEKYQKQALENQKSLRFDGIPLELLTEKMQIDYLKSIRFIAPIDIRLRTKKVFQYVKKNDISMLRVFPISLWDKQSRKEFLKTVRDGITLLPDLTKEEIEISIASFPDNILLVPKFYRETAEEQQLTLWDFLDVSGS